MNKTIITLASLSLLVLSGCTSTSIRLYEGEELPLSEISIIKAPEPQSLTWIDPLWRYDIYSIDGHKKELKRYFTSPKEVQVLPGEHSVVYRLSTNNGVVESSMHLSFTFVTQAGETYILRDLQEKIGSSASRVVHKYWIETSDKKMVDVPIYFDGINFSDIPFSTDSFRQTK